MNRLMLLVDTRCGPCSDLGKQAKALGGGRLEVEGLSDPAWRGLVPPDEPVLLEPATGRQWRRLRLLLKLAAVVGPGNAVALLRLAGARAGESGVAQGPKGSVPGGLRVAARIAIGSRPAGAFSPESDR